MEIKRYNEALNLSKELSFYDAFDTYIKDQTVVGQASYPPFGNKISPDVAKRYYGEGIIFENGYKILYYGGGCSGEDCNTTFIVDDNDVLIARNDW
jgi:hypothetical protein